VFVECLSDVLLEQTLVGPSPNIQLLSYLRHAVATQVNVMLWNATIWLHMQRWIWQENWTLGHGRKWSFFSYCILLFFFGGGSVLHD